MPIDTETKTNMIEKIKTKQGTEKLRLVGLYKQLMDMYDEDHKYSTIINNISYDAHEKIRELSSKAMQIMRNQLPVVEDDLVEKDEFFTKEEQETEDFKKEITDQADMPNFWLDLLLKIPRVAFMITDKDKEVLAYLDHIEIFKNQDNSNFRIELSFKENEFFTNQKLVIESESNEEDESEIEKIKCDGINWKNGKNYLVTTAQKKVGNKKGKKKTVEKESRTESFFWIFKNYDSKDFEVDEEDEIADFDMEPTSDRCLFDMACDFIDLMANDFLVYFIPAYYDIKVHNFEDQCESEEGEGEHCEKKPQNCKQQ